MNKRKTLLMLTILSLTIFPNNIYAECTKEEINNFKKIKDEYKITYEFNKDTKTYTMYFYESDPDNYKYYMNIEKLPEETEYEIIDDNNIKCNNVPSGKYEIAIISTSETCNNALQTEIITLPKYNMLSEDPLCQGIEEFVLCQPTYEKDIDYDTFVSRVNTYKKTKTEKEVENNNVQDEEKEENKILSYIQENLFQIIVVTVFVILVIVTIILTAKSVKKSRRLE